MVHSKQHYRYQRYFRDKLGRMKTLYAVKPRNMTSYRKLWRRHNMQNVVEKALNLSLEFREAKSEGKHQRAQAVPNWLWPLKKF